MNRFLPKIGIPQNGSFIVENPINMDDLGVPLFSETSNQRGVEIVCFERANRWKCLIIEKRNRIEKDFALENGQTCQRTPIFKHQQSRGVKLHSTQVTACDYQV